MKKSIVCIFVLLLAGCAGTAGRHKATMPLIVPLSKYVNLSLTSENTREVLMLQSEHERIRSLIVHKIIKKAGNRFKEINSVDKKLLTLQATLIFTKYDKGNAFARAMLIGLGQIHINATLELKDGDTQELIGVFKIKKTFAWGGMYGGFTKIDGAEDGFADAVVEVIFEKN